MIPPVTRDWEKIRRRLRRPAVLGTARRTAPLSDSWGRDRGTAVDRWFIEQFLESHRTDISGRVLEVMDPRYTRRFGTDVTASDVLDVKPTDQATLVADLTRPESFDEARFDCFVMTQTLQFVRDPVAAARSSHRLLDAGGVLLVTAPCVSRLDAGSRSSGEYWRFTPDGLRSVLSTVFDDLEVVAFGNVLTCVAFLLGMAKEELRSRELETADPFFPLLVAARAVKRDPLKAAAAAAD
jgi:SAM-dependent methyltransferase